MHACHVVMSKETELLLDSAGSHLKHLAAAQRLKASLPVLWRMGRHGHLKLDWLQVGSGAYASCSLNIVCEAMPACLYATVGRASHNIRLLARCPIDPCCACAPVS